MWLHLVILQWKEVIFFDFYGARPQRWQEGLKGRFNSQPLNTRYDYIDYVKKILNTYGDS